MLNEYTVGVPVDMTLILKDANANAIGLMASYPTIGAYFTDHSNARITMDPSTFTYSTLDGSITIPVLATRVSDQYLFSLTVTVDGDPVPAPQGVDSSQIVVIPGAPYASTSLLSGMLSQYTAGVSVDMTLVLRDSYSNVVGVTDSYPTISVYFTNFNSVRTDLDSGSFTYSTVDGSITIPVLTTTASGQHPVSLTVEVDGNPVPAPIGVNSSQIEVIAAALVLSASVLTGMLSEYIVNVPVNLTVTLADMYGNAVGPVESFPTIAAYFTDISSSRMTLDPSTFIYSSLDGSITIPVLSTVDSGPNAFSLTVEVGGNILPSPTGIDNSQIVVTTGILSISTSTCQTWLSVPSYEDNVVYCSPMDVYSHVLAWPNLYLKSFFKSQSDTTVIMSVLGVAATGSNTSYVLNLTAGSATVPANPYSVYTLIGQPGGLLAQYFSTSSFTDIISVGDGILTDPRHVDESAFEYTRIDSTVSLANSGALTLTGQTVSSIRWTGVLLPPSSASSFTVSVVATGSVKVFLGGQTRIDLATGSPASGSYTFTPSAGQLPIELVVEYVPSSAAAIQLRCVYPGSIPSGGLVIPQSMLLSPLNVGTQAPYTFVPLGPVSLHSQTYYSGQTSLRTSHGVTSATGSIYVQLNDINWNPYWKLPTRCVGNSPGTVPDCLIRVTTTAGSWISLGSVHDNGDGSLRWTVRATSTGTAVFNVMLQTSSGVYSHVAFSPKSVTFTSR